MTAEQLLIKENKINPKIKFITKSRNEIWFWRNKPQYLGYWCNGSGYMIGMSVAFDGKEDNDCILCIDDIKPEVPPIPEKWYIECTEENREILNDWRLKKCSDFFKKENDFLVNEFLLSKHPIDNSFYCANTIEYLLNECSFKEYKEITLDQFKKYVLGEEKEEEKQEENSSSHSTGSYVKSGSIGSVGFSGQYVKSGRIVSVDINDNPFPSPKTNSTFEFYSTRCWIEDRINYINQFVKRNMDSDLCIPTEWVEERNELVEKLKNL